MQDHHLVGTMVCHVEVERSSLDRFMHANKYSHALTWMSMIRENVFVTLTI